MISAANPKPIKADSRMLRFFVARFRLPAADHGQCYMLSGHEPW